MVTGEYPPQPGGVSDYTRLVARAPRLRSASAPPPRCSPRPAPARGAGGRPVRPERVRLGVDERGILRLAPLPPPAKPDLGHVPRGLVPVGSLPRPRRSGPDDAPHGE